MRNNKSHQLPTYSPITPIPYAECCNFKNQAYIKNHLNLIVIRISLKTENLNDEKFTSQIF